MNYLLAFLCQTVLYLLCFLADEYGGSLFAAIIGGVCFAVWSISHVAEWIEPSRVSSAYYRYVLTGWLAPAFTLGFYVALRGGFEWMRL